MLQYADFCAVTTSYMEETKMRRSKLASLGIRGTSIRLISDFSTHLPASSSSQKKSLLTKLALGNDSCRANPLGN
jgi:hypothetical protein